jgi:hypothetical protein
VELLPYQAKFIEAARLRQGQLAIKADIPPVRKSDYEWCAKIAVQRMESADQIESLLIHQFRGNKVALLAYLGIEGEGP